MEKDDPIDRGRMQESFETWEQEAKRRLQSAQAGQSASVEETEMVEETAAAQQTAGIDVESAAAPAKEAVPAAPTGSEQAGFEKELSLPRYGLPGLLVEAALLAALLYWAWHALAGKTLPGLPFVQSGSLAFTCVGAALFLLADGFGARVLARGIVSLFTLGSSTASASALAFFGALAAFAAVLTGGKAGSVGVFYTVSACACLLFEKIADLLDALRLRNDARVAPSGFPLHLLRLEDEEGKTHSYIACPGTAGSESLSHDGAARSGGRAISILSFLLFIAAAAAAVVGYLLFHRTVTETALLFASVACAGAPLLSGLCAALPLLHAQKVLRRVGAGLSGYGAARSFGRVDALLLPERLLYPEGQVRVCAVRPLDGRGEEGVEDAVLTAAGVASAAQMAIAPAILGMVVGAQNLLKPVENLRIRDEMGVEAQVNGRQVLFGSRSLLRQRRVDLTGRMLMEIEAKYSVQGNDFLYLAVDGHPAAMFVLQYRPLKKLAEELRGLLNAGVCLLAQTADPNLTRDQIAEQFHLRRRMTALMPQAQSGQMKEETPSAGVTVLCDREAGSVQARAAAACSLLRETAQISTIVQILGSVVSGGLVLFLTLFQGWIMDPMEMLGLQAVWALPAFLVAAFHRCA